MFSSFFPRHVWYWLPCSPVLTTNRRRYHNFPYKIVMKLLILTGTQLPIFRGHTTKIQKHFCILLTPLGSSEATIQPARPFCWYYGSLRFTDPTPHHDLNGLSLDNTHTTNKRMVHTCSSKQRCTLFTYVALNASSTPQPKHFLFFLVNWKCNPLTKTHAQP